MRKILSALAAVTVLGIASPAFAEWTITNNDHSNYELIKSCGGKTEAWSIAGKVSKRLSIPAGTTSCTITVKSNGTSCTVKDGQGCTIASGKIQRQ